MNEYIIRNPRTKKIQYNKCNNYINKNQFTKLNELKLKKLRRKKYLFQMILVLKIVI